MSAQPRILYYVQHLLGVGHVFRTMRVVSALVQRGLAVDLVYGGIQLPDFDAQGANVHFLPSLVSSKGDFSSLLGEDGSPASDHYKEDRRDRLLALLAGVKPDIVVTEAFPFGRRQMHFELLPFMDAIQDMVHRPLVFCSIRDILQTGNKPKKDLQTVDLVSRYFDGVLVHGDRDLIPLSETFPFADDLTDKVFYTGIVAPEIRSAPPEIFDVVVSAGGGLLGRELIEASLLAKTAGSMKDASWCVLTGPYLEPSEFDRLKGVASSDTVFRDFMPNLHETLAKAQMSISLAGYNTVADLMSAGCRAIIAPQWNDKETEQLQRAELLAKRGLVEMIGHEDKNAPALAAAIDRVLDRPVPDWSSISHDGANRTGDILISAAQGDDLGQFR